MKNGTMFSDLCSYTDADFCKEHPIINFDTLSGFGEYQVVAVFKFNTNHEDFRYNEYTQMNEEQFKEFMSQVHARQCYDTGIDAEYGDQLITLYCARRIVLNVMFVVLMKNSIFTDREKWIPLKFSNLCRFNKKFLTLNSAFKVLFRGDLSKDIACNNAIVDTMRVSKQVIETILMEELQL